ncbi:protein ELF4-LIKE 3-like [Curcuma longa]|uniref:protein ELF4-LIKE 3-like n=1 Tax=Curcuma longa TaxID=136217 RepID=UPI003D9ECE44
MDGRDAFSLLGNGKQVDNRVMQSFQRSFVQVQSLLDQNRLLINEINQNHESKIPENLGRNVGLIRELNNNIRRVVDVYSELSLSFSRPMEASPEGNSQGKLGPKRLRPG